MNTLTPAQREALDALPAKRRMFVLSYCELGNATEAARRAGYAKPDPEGARVLGNVRVRAAIEALRAPVEAVQIASVERLRELWSRWAHEGTIERTIDGKRVSEPLASREMLKASEMLAKSQGAFLERQHVTLEGAGAPALIAVAPSDLDAAKFMRGGKGE
jgi:phage terminase small subunit